MNEITGPYRIVDLSLGRRVWLNVLHLPGPKNSMYGLLEVDVTIPRQLIAEFKTRTGEKLSFTGFISYCLARAVDEDKQVQAYLKGRKQLVLFDDVDVGLMVEHKSGDKRALMGTVIKGVNHKSFLEIHREIRTVQSNPAPPGRGMPGWFRTGMLLPWPLSRLFSALISLAMSRDPTIAVSMGGTVAVTAVGMFAEGHTGWGIFPLNQPLGLVVGSINWKPAVVNGRVVPREMLNLTVTFNHDIVDGAPAARFTRRLVELIESGYGLDEFQLPVEADIEAEMIIAETII